MENVKDNFFTFYFCLVVDINYYVKIKEKYTKIKQINVNQNDICAYKIILFVSVLINIKINYK